MQEQLQNIIKQISPVPGLGLLNQEQVMAAHHLPAITSLRLNPLKVSTAFDKAEKVPWCDAGRYLTERPIFTLDPLLHAGAYYVQEASSMFVAHTFNSLKSSLKRPVKVLDLCAAPGGKSTLLASLIEENDLLISNEVIQNRAGILAENLSRWGQMNTWVTNNDPADFAGLHNYFDVMLVDAPCTGSGLWRKDADALNEWSTDHVKLCSERQKRILADALPCLKPGGFLIYATCSYSPEENENITDWIIDTLHLSNLGITIKDEWQIVQTQSEKHKAKGYRFYPWRLQGEGFFLSLFQKQWESESSSDAKKEKKKKEQRTNSKTKDQSAIWQPWLNNEFHLVEKMEEFYAVPVSLKEDYLQISSALRIKKTGTALGKIAGRDVIPHHELALSVHLNNQIKNLEVPLQEALQFLKKEEIRKENSSKSWQVVTFEGLGLGWGKWLPNRMNNYLPKNLRIRMDIKEI